MDPYIEAELVKWESAKRQDGDHRTLSILLLKSIKYMVYYTFLDSKVAAKYIMVCKEYILLFRLIIYVIHSFTHTFSTIYRAVLRPSSGNSTKC